MKIQLRRVRGFRQREIARYVKVQPAARKSCHLGWARALQRRDNR